MQILFVRDKEGIASDRSCGIGLTVCKGKNCDFKEIANLQRENKEKINIIEQMIKILYPNANNDELYDVTFNGEYIDKLKELKDTADTMLMANDIKKQDIDSLREANKRLEQENKELKDNNNHLQAIIDDGRAENKRFREENKKLKKDVQLFKCLDTFGESECRCACRCLGNEFCEDADKKINTYRSALEEIRKTIKSYDLTVDNGTSVDALYTIRKIINEALQ